MKALCSGSILANCLPMPSALLVVTKCKILPFSKYWFNGVGYPGISSTMKGPVPDTPALLLSAFLRALRERQTPADHGLAAGKPRRTPGRSPQQGAPLGAWSVTWYTAI